MRQVFKLQWVDYDLSEDHYFLAPENTTEETFLSLCNSLLKEAAIEACGLKGDTWNLNDKVQRDDGMKFYVGWGNIVHVLAHKLLPKYGYEQIKLPTVTYSGSSIIDGKNDNTNEILPEDVMKALMDYNKEVEDENKAARESRCAEGIYGLQLWTTIKKLEAAKNFTFEVSYL